MEMYIRWEQQQIRTLTTDDLFAYDVRPHSNKLVWEERLGEAEVSVHVTYGHEIQ